LEKKIIEVEKLNKELLAEKKELKRILEEKIVFEEEYKAFRKAYKEETEVEKEFRGVLSKIINNLPN